MSKLNIITLPDPLLKKVSEPVEQVDDELRQLMDDMLETMYAAPGVGLAAIQVAVPRRLIVMDTARDDEEKRPFCMVNPEIVELSDELRLHEEGCLSIPEVYAEVERPAGCRVQFINREGNRQELEAEGILSTVIQHEVDHLNGVLFIDHISRLKRNMMIKKFLKAQKDEEAL